MLRRVMMAAATASAGYDAQILSLAPWGYWKLDENPPASGGAAADSSGNGRNGTYTPDTFATAAGLFASSPRCPIFVTASTQGVTLPNFTNSGAFSFALFASSTTTGLQQLLSIDDGNSSRLFQFRFDGGASNKIDFVGIDAGSAATTVVSPTAVNDGLAHLVAGVYDASLSAAAGRLKLYVDGSESARSTTNFVIKPATGSPRIAHRAVGDNWLSGKVSNVAIWSRALSAAEIADLWLKRNEP